MRLQRTNETRGEKETFLYLFLSSFLSIFLASFLDYSFLPSFLPYVAFPRMSRERDSHLTTVFHRGGGTQLYGLRSVSWKDRSHPLLRLFGRARVTSFTDQLLLFLTFFFPSSSSNEEPGEKVSLGCRKKQSRSHLGITSDTFAFLRLFVQSFSTRVSFHSIDIIRPTNISSMTIIILSLLLQVSNKTMDFSMLLSSLHLSVR